MDHNDIPLARVLTWDVIALVVALIVIGGVAGWLLAAGCALGC